MNTSVIEQPTAPPAPRTSLVARFAERYGVEPTRMLDTLKATAFKTSGAAISNEQMMALLVVAEQHRLNPFTREIFAFPDKGGIVPVVSLDGWARIINEHPMFDGLEFDFDGEQRSMTCTIHRKDRAHPISVTEYMAECQRNTQPWNSHPRRMLRHKALIQCARLAFGFAGIYDEDEADRIVRAAEPPATSAARVSRLLKRQEAPLVDRVDDDDPPPLGDYDTLLQRMQKAATQEDAELVLDEARGLLSQAEQSSLEEAFQARQQPEQA